MKYTFPVFITAAIVATVCFGFATVLHADVITPHKGIAPNALSANAALEDVRSERDKFWDNAHQEVDKGVLELVAQHQTELERGLQYHTLLCGDGDKKQIALTFDDGPHALYTPQILAILARYHVPATFFLVGEMAERRPDLVMQIVAAGDTVGNHTYDHVSLPKIPEEYVATEIKTCGSVLEKITGRAPHLFRPPGGEYNPRIAETAEALGYTMILWTDDPGDYASPGAKVIEDRTLAKMSAGGIILLHDGIQQTIDVLPQIIEYGQAHGYEFITVDKMLGERATAPAVPLKA